MGSDTPLAVLSDRAQPLFNYFQQLFAQVTNPPLDAIREELVTSVLTGAGGEGNLLDPRPESCRQIALESPILDNDEMSRLKQLDGWRGFKSTTLSMTFPAADGGRRHGQGARLDVREGRRRDQGRLEPADPLRPGREARGTPRSPRSWPARGCTTTSSGSGMRTRAGLILECGDAREVHHFALLLGYGAGSINPYLAFETLDDMIGQGMIRPDVDHAEAVGLYRKAIKKGVVKVMSKMGISTIQSYRGAQIFEAIGLNKDFIDRYFDKTASRIGGIGLEEIARETLYHHRRAYADREVGPPMLDWGGLSTSGAARGNSTSSTPRPSSGSSTPPTPAGLRHLPAILEGWSTSRTSGSAPSAACSTSSSTAGPRCRSRRSSRSKSILTRFATGAMSYGSISGEAHETLAIAMNRIGGRSNTGEGARTRRGTSRTANGDDRRSKVKQVASGRFGVTSEYLVSADEIQIKVAQGAKPGEGGQLPGQKVWPWIAKVRFSTPGVSLISPPPHHDIYSIEDLAQLIHDLKNANPRARISVKLVAEVGVGTVAAGVAKAHSDVIMISGHDGGTGASP